MKTIISFSIVILFSIILFYNGCKDSVTAAQLDNVVIPDSNVSYAKYIQPVFNLKCINCHGNGQVAGGVDLTTWSGTTADPDIVFPGLPNNSRLVWDIQGKPGANAMPPLGSAYKPLTNNQVNGVITWIKEGAKNN